MEKTDKEVLQVTKEIVVKFIETQRISPNNLDKMFQVYYVLVLTAVRERQGDIVE